MSSDPAVLNVEAAMLRIRRSSTRRALGRAAEHRLGVPVDLSLAAVVDAVEDGPATVGNIALRLGLDPSRASRVSARAVQAGLLTRGVSQADGRRVELSLTNAGHMLAQQLRGFRRRSFATAMQDWTAADRDTFADLLTRFIDALEHAEPPIRGKTLPGASRRSERS